MFGEFIAKHRDDALRRRMPGVLLSRGKKVSAEKSQGKKRTNTNYYFFKTPRFTTYFPNRLWGIRVVDEVNKRMRNQKLKCKAARKETVKQDAARLRRAAMGIPAACLGRKRTKAAEDIDIFPRLKGRRWCLGNLTGYHGQRFATAFSTYPGTLIFKRATASLQGILVL